VGNLTAADLEKLATLPRESLRFMLKVGSPPEDPGNFSPVDIGGSGATLYRANIATCNPAVIGPGTVLETEPGNMVGPTVQGARDLCQPYYASGACGNGKGGLGIIIKAPLWVTTDKVAGKTSVTVKMIGAFSLDTVTASAEVIGHFLRVTDDGAIGTTPGALVRVILVR
jgi:hypothetical protein